LDDNDKPITLLFLGPSVKTASKETARKFYKFSSGEAIWKEKFVFPSAVLRTEFMYILQTSGQDLFMHYLM
jgi:hypothetical protein